MVKKINSEEFRKTIEETTNKIVVDCYADWCGPCKMLAPIMDEVSEELNNCDFYKINVDESGEIAAEYGIMSIPTILIFENGSLKTQTSGFMSKSELIEFINS